MEIKRVQEISTPQEILDLICPQTSDLTDHPETITRATIERFLAQYPPSHFTDRELYYRLETEAIEESMSEYFDFKEEDFDEFGGLVDPEKIEVYHLLKDSLKKIQLVIGDILAERGNIVHSVAKTYESPFDENSAPFIWLTTRKSANRVIKEVPADRPPHEKVYRSPAHPRMIQEVYVPLIREDGTWGTIAFADNYSEYDDLDNAININMKESIQAIIDAMEAGKFLHSQGLVHRDIKLENIMICEEDGKIRGKLCDHEFIANHNQHIREMCGTQEYMDLAWYPYREYLARVPTKAMDIFAFGMCLLLLHVEYEDRHEFLNELRAHFRLAFIDAQQELLEENVDLLDSIVENGEIQEELLLRAIQKKVVLPLNTNKILSEFLEDYYPSANIPPAVLELIAQMLGYYRENRPSLNQAQARLRDLYNIT